MPLRAGYSTPLLHVADVRRSLRFYELLGFETIDVEGDPPCPGWARAHCEGGALMFLLAEEPHDPHAQSIILCMYTPDLPALRAQLLEAGLNPAPIHYPEYMPSGEMRLEDPDGYVVLINHWSDREHEAWESRRQERLDAAGLSKNG